MSGAQTGPRSAAGETPDMSENPRPTPLAAPAPAYDALRFFPVAASRRAHLRRRLGFSGNVLLVIDAAATTGLVRVIEAFAHVARRQADAVLRLAVTSPAQTFAQREQLAFLHRRAA